MTFASGREIPSDLDDEAFLAFNAHFSLENYVSCSDIVDGNIDVLLTDGVDLTESVVDTVDTTVPGSITYVLACVDSDGNSTINDFTIHISFSEVVAALQRISRSSNRRKLEEVAEINGLTIEACDGESSAGNLFHSTWGVAWHPRAIEEVFTYCALSSIEPSDTYLSEFVTVLADIHEIDQTLADDLIFVNMVYAEVTSDKYSVSLSAEIHIPTTPPETLFGEVQYDCTSPTCPHQRCPQCSA